DFTTKTARAQREWLRRVLAETGLKPSPLAEKSGIAKTTILRFLDEDDQSPRVLHAGTINKIASATGIAPPGAVPEIHGLLRRPLRGRRDDGVPFNAADYAYGGEIEQAIAALKGARNAADGWVLKTSAVELEGYLPGDVVLVDLGREPQPG